MLEKDKPALSADNDSLQVLVRRPQPSDGHAIGELQRPDELRPSLARDALSALTSRFADTCLVAEIGKGVVGFVGALRPASNPSSLVVWQIDVDTAVRQRGLGSALLHALIHCPGCTGIEYVEATVHSANAGGRGLFLGFARDLRAPCEISAASPEGHALLRIGPIRVENAMKLEKPDEAL